MRRLRCSITHHRCHLSRSFALLGKCDATTCEEKESSATDFVVNPRSINSISLADRTPSFSR